MDVLFGGLPAWSFVLACLITLFAGFVKGTIGFAMPLIMISALSSIMAPDIALAALIVSVLTTNLQQSLRFGWKAAIQTSREYWRMIAMIALGIAISAPFVVGMSHQLLFVLLGVPVTGYALMQIFGWRPRMDPRHRNKAEVGLGLVGGLYGGISGVWGPPVIVYLLAIDAPKPDMVRVQGVVYLLGAVVLTVAHLGSGVLNPVTLPLSFAMVVPATLGMWLGFKLQDKLNAERFRFWTLIVLIVIALNLLRRGLMG